MKGELRLIGPEKLSNDSEMWAWTRDFPENVWHQTFVLTKEERQHSRLVIEKTNEALRQLMKVLEEAGLHL